MTQPNLLQLARQGNVSAIATLLDRALPKSGMAVKVSLKDGCLRVILESAEVPDRTSTLNIIRSGMMRLKPASIELVKVYGRKIEQRSPAWTEEFTLQPLAEPKTSNSAQHQVTNLKQLAKQGDVDAIATLLNRALEHKQITAKVMFNDACLKVVLEAERVPEQDVAVILIDRELIKLHLQFIKQVEIDGQQIGNPTPAWHQGFEPGTRVNAPISHLPKSSTLPTKHHQELTNKSQFFSFISNLPIQSLDKEGWQSVAAGFFLAILLLLASPLTFIFSYFIILVHELGHTLTAWIFGYPSIPSFDFIYGGGVTMQFERAPLLEFLIYSAIVFLCYLYRSQRSTLVFFMFFAFIYSIVAFTKLHEMLMIFMGHGFELIFAGIFLYRAISGYGSRSSIERPLYAMLAFFTVFYDIRFAWLLVFDSETRSIYEEGKGGLLDGDFVRLAGEYLGVDLSIVVTFFLLLCFLTPLLTFLCFRYRNVWIYFILKLLAREELDY